MDSQQLDALLEVAKKHNLSRLSYRGEVDFDADFRGEPRNVPFTEEHQVVTADEIIMRQIEEARKASLKMGAI